MWSQQIEVSIQNNDKDMLVQLFKDKQTWQTKDDDLSSEPLSLEIPEDRAKVACWYRIGGTSSSKYKCSNVDKPRCSPLHVAAMYGNKDIMRLLRDYCPVDCEDSYGATALMYACWKGNLTTVKLLVTELNSNVNFMGKVSGPLHEACEHGHRHIVEWLLALPTISINARTRFSKETALTKARSSKHSEIIALLIAKGASDEHYTQSSENVPQVENTRTSDITASIERITNLEQTVTDLTDKITNIDNKIEECSVTNRSFNDSINTVSTTIASFETDFKATLSMLKKDANQSKQTLEEKLAITNKEIHDLKAVKITLTDSMANVRSNMKKLSTDIDNNNKQQAALVNEITEKFTAVKVDMEKCKQQVLSTMGIATSVEEAIETIRRETNVQFELMSKTISEIKQR